MTFAMSYGLSFAGITSTVVHTWIYYRKQIVYQSRRSLKEQPDIHARLMSVYAEVPNYWYAIIFGELCFLLGCARGRLLMNGFAFSDHVRLWHCGDRGLADRHARLGVHLLAHHMCVVALGDTQSWPDVPSPRLRRANRHYPGLDEYASPVKVRDTAHSRRRY